MKASLLIVLVLGVAWPARAQQLDDPDRRSVAVTLPAPNATVDVPPPIIVPPPAFAGWSLDDPRNYKPVRNYGLMIAGLVVFGVPALGSAAASEFAGGYLGIPIAGPIVVAAQVAGDPFARGVTTMLVLDSVVQVAGVTMTLVGALTHHRGWNPPVAIAPIAGRDHAGAALTLRF